MNYRKLRIAWSVAWGIVCLLLIVLWVRGKWRDEIFVWQPTATKTYGIESAPGRFSLTTWEHPPFNGPGSDPAESRAFTYQCRILGEGPNNWDGGKNLPMWGRDAIRSRPDLLVFNLPAWFVPLVAGLIAAAPLLRLPTRFSLRTLLIVLTVAAIGLGWIVYALKA